VRRHLVFEAVYAQLRQLAQQKLVGENPGLDLQPTALVHEAYLKLVDLNRMNMQGRGHFLGMAGRIMREIIVDEARRVCAQKRDRALETRLTGEFLGGGLSLEEIVGFDETLKELGNLHPEYLWLVEARVFSGMTIEETAAELGVSSATVKRKWRVARAWIATRMRLHEGSDDQPGAQDDVMCN
jgi:RNA polymerase sigma factor (TIGR02999 family)